LIFQWCSSIILKKICAISPATNSISPGQSIITILLQNKEVIIMAKKKLIVAVIVISLFAVMSLCGMAVAAPKQSADP
jgi:hypothetical protein